MKRELRPLDVRVAEAYESIKHIKGIPDEQKAIHALGLATTPDERWEMLVNLNRPMGFWLPLDEKK